MVELISKCSLCVIGIAALNTVSAQLPYKYKSWIVINCPELDFTLEWCQLMIGGSPSLHMMSSAIRFMHARTHTHPILEDLLVHFIKMFCEGLMHLKGA